MIEKIAIVDIPDTKIEPDGYDDKTVPDMSAKNVAFIIDKLNEVIEVINLLKYQTWVKGE